MADLKLIGESVDASIKFQSWNLVKVGLASGNWLQKAIPAAQFSCDYPSRF